MHTNFFQEERLYSKILLYIPKNFNLPFIIMYYNTLYTIIQFFFRNEEENKFIFEHRNGSGERVLLNIKGMRNVTYSCLKH